jgi:sugar phosphate isomerase/epimerase
MAIALGKDAIYHVHAKDCRKEKGRFAANGGLETKSIDQCNTRSWNYVALGYGCDDQWWREFISVLSMLGYDGPLSMEIEDMTMPLEVGVRKSCEFLKGVMPRVF